jgi:hypothetical protein
LALTIVRVTSGGIPVTESATGFPYYEADNGFGIPVTFGSTGIPLGRAGTSGPSLYLGQVATRTFIPNTFNGTNKQIMSRTFHYARDAITSLQLVIPNFYFNLLASPGSTEAGPGSGTSITASIEYPAATFTQVKFSGSATGSPADNSLLVSDAVSIAIPNGAQFFVRTWFSNANGIMFGLYSSSNGLSTGDGTVFGVTTPDLTMSGSITQATNVVGVAPCAIIAQTRKASVYLLGDSRVFGLRDTGDSSGDLGELARSLGPTLAYINGGCPGDRSVDFTTGTHGANRRALMAYTSHMISNFGINDVTAGNSPASVLSAYQTITGYHPGPKYICTIAPQTTGAWTLANGSDQTVTANEANRVSLNTSIRSGVANFAGRGHAERRQMEG